jgi:coproporphyrinogen III oxidase-like Fe-S oxidoreductase
LPDGGLHRRRWNSKELSGWTREGEVLGPEEIREERIMLGLRTSDGIEPELLAKEAQAGSVQRQVAEAEWQLPVGLEWNGGRIRIAENDWFVADEIIANLI